jgi:hypothetical protein
LWPSSELWPLRLLQLPCLPEAQLGWTDALFGLELPALA